MKIRLENKATQLTSWKTVCACCERADLIDTPPANRWRMKTYLKFIVWFGQMWNKYRQEMPAVQLVINMNQVDFVNELYKSEKYKRR